MQKTYRVGRNVPSSNTTMETEIPAMLAARTGKPVVPGAGALLSGAIKVATP